MTTTTDPHLRSFIHYDDDSHFPIQNLPYGIFSHNGQKRVGVRIGDFVLDMTQLEERGFFASLDLPKLFATSELNLFFSQGKAAWAGIRKIVSELLRHDQPQLRDNVDLRSRLLLPVEEVQMEMPVSIGDYTDFYSSKEHATNVGIMFRGRENALMPNWLHLPVAYHGRSSSVVISGTPVMRPCGQILEADQDNPIYGPCRLLDFELEMGFFTGPASTMGSPVPVESAKDHIFGMVLVNDWSARDIQKWEYQPLGPFNAKNFATSISPWVVPLIALEPFRCQGPEQSPPPLAYLQTNGNRSFDIQLEVYLQNSLIVQSNFKYLYWNMSQQLAHHTVTGCNIRPGDLMASGTISGPTADSFGSMLELCWKGTKDVQLANGEIRKFLRDGDRVTMTGFCQGDGYRIGFGEVTGEVLPADCLKSPDS